MYCSLTTYSPHCFSIVPAVISCTEKIAFYSDSFESMIVIEGTITNEQKIQTIKISRTYPFEEEGPLPESN